MEDIHDSDVNIIPDKVYLSELDRAVINNDYEKIVDLISRGSVIFAKDKLCNGFLMRKYKGSHTKCIKSICHKTAVYFAFLMNHTLIRHFVYYLKEINSCDNNSNIADESNALFEKINNIKCGCMCLNTFNVQYDTNYYKYNTFLNLLDDMKNIVNKIIVKINHSTLSTIRSGTADRQLRLINGLYEFNCIHDKMDLTCKENSNLYRDLVIIYDNLLMSNKIVKLLLDQQCYEIYKFYLNTKNCDLQNKIDEIYSDSFVDINFVDLCDKKNIFLMTLKDGDNEKIINKLLEKGFTFPDNINHILKDLLEMNYTKNVTLLLEKVKLDTLLNPNNISHILINNNKINIADKINMINILASRKYLDDNLELSALKIDSLLIYDCIANDYSLDILTALAKNEDFKNHIDQNVITYAIKLLKCNELDILLKYGKKSLINSTEAASAPILLYLKQTTQDTSENIKLLEVLLKYDPCFEITDENSIGPLLLAVKKNRKITVSLMINKGADPFCKDQNGNNALHVAIKENYQDIIKILAQYKKENIYLINEPDKYMKSPLMLALETVNPISIFTILLQVDGINLDYFDSRGTNILNYIIDSKKLDDSAKYELFHKLIARNVDLLEVNRLDSKPIVVKATETNLFNIVILIMNKLITSGEIQVGENDIVKAINNNTFENISVRDNTRPNFYSLVVLYLRQNMYKLQQENQNREKHLLKHHIIIKWLFMTVVMILGLLEKKCQKIEKNLAR